MSEKKKVISVMIPTYNEEENARPIYEAVRDEIRKDCPDYDYEILFIDNKSQDRTRRIITDICAQDPKVKAIFNSKNFGQFNSPYYGMIHTTRGLHHYHLRGLSGPGGDDSKVCG